jgi:hypothetical protein
MKNHEETAAVGSKRDTVRMKLINKRNVKQFCSQLL